MKKYLLLLFMFLNAMLAKSQGLYIDSLKKALTEAAHDTTRVLLKARLGEAYVRLNPDTGFAYTLEALEMAQKINYLKGELYIAAVIGRYWWSMGEYATTIKLLLPKIPDLEKLEDIEVSAFLYGVISDSYRDQGSHDEALVYAFKSIEQLKKRPVCLWCRITYVAIASNYLGKKDLDSTNYYLRLANTYPVDKGLEGWPLFITGKTFAAQKNYDSALFYYKQSFPSLIEEKNLKDLADAYTHVASLYKITGQIDSSIFYLQRSLSVSQPNKFAKEAMEAFLQLSISYEKLNTDSALHYYKKAIVAKDSLTTRINNNKYWFLNSLNR
jgi:two-component system, NtrC family, sensor kinase